ncbi:hypothetical protein AB0C31_33770, partial [Actinoplanes philippinensis]
MRRSALRRLALPVTALIVTVLVLAPLAAPGYVLSYDMVFVPRQPLRWDLVLPSATLPRAVPLDALVSLATQVVPGWLLQRVALAAARAIRTRSPRRGFHQGVFAFRTLDDTRGMI